MQVLVIYESMFGNTHTIAGCIGEGLAALGEVSVVPVAEATPEALAAAGVVVVGGPTHVHGMVRASTQQEAVKQAAADDDRELDPDAEGPVLRDWFDELADVETAGSTPAAAFDTRVGGVSAVLTGRASKGIAKRLRRQGFPLVVDAESFLVDKQETLMDGEEARAVAWGATVADAVRAWSDT